VTRKNDPADNMRSKMSMRSFASEADGGARPSDGDTECMSHHGIADKKAAKSRSVNRVRTAPAARSGKKALSPAAEREYPNETMGVLYERASCRAFSEKKISRKLADTIIGAGLRAPTGGNLQPYSIIRIEDPASRSKLAAMCGQKFIAEAPLNLLFCIDWRRLGRWADLGKAPFAASDSFRHFWISFQDVVACAQNICTAADAMGLGSVYIGTVIDNVGKVRKLFRLPEKVFAVVLLCVGYPKARMAPRRKLGIDTIVHDERYRDIDDGELLSAFGEKYEGQKVPITPENLKTMRRVCLKIGGSKFAEECVADVERRGYYNPVQRYFGLHYRADITSSGNENYLSAMEKSGFGWFHGGARGKNIRKH